MDKLLAHGQIVCSLCCQDRQVIDAGCACIHMSDGFDMTRAMQEPEALQPGAGSGHQDVTELDAWLKCGALSAVGMPVQEVTDYRLALQLSMTLNWPGCWHLRLLLWQQCAHCVCS